MHDARSRAIVCALLIVVSAALNGTVSARGQSPRIEPTFESAMADAHAAFTDHDWDAADAAFTRVRDIARGRHDDLWEARGLSGLGSVADARARYVEARALLLTALATFERLNATADIAQASQSLGSVAISLDDSRDAVARYERAAAAFAAIGDDESRRWAAFNAVRADDSSATLSRLDQLRQDARAVENRRLEATILHTWSDRLYRLGSYDDAIARLEEAEQLFEGIGDREDLATTYNSLGRLYRAHGQPHAALQYQLKALYLQRTLNSPRGHIQSLNAVAVTYQTLGDKTRARSYFEQAMDAAQRTGSSTILNFLRANMGDFLVDTGEVARGRAMLEQAVEDAPPSMLAIRNLQLADAYTTSGMFDAARQAANRALAACVAAEAPVQCISAYVERSRAEQGLGSSDEAFGDSKQALAGIEMLHRKLAPSDFLKQDFHDVWRAVYSNAIALAARRGDMREALEIGELARSRAFADLLASKNLGERQSSEPPSLLQRGAPVAMLLTSQAAAPPVTAGDLAAIAARLHSTIVTYWVGQGDIVMWVIGRDGAVHGARVVISRSKLDDLIRSTAAFDSPTRSDRVAVTRGDTPIPLAMKTTTAWRDLYNVLIKPIERALPRTPGARLTIIPHGPLINLPFAALRDSGGRYLVERYTIHEVPSAAVLQLTTVHHSTDARHGAVLLVADPARPPRIAGERPLARLPGAAQEVTAIARLLAPGQATLLSADAATERRVVDESSHKAVVHFATHAIVRETDPLSSFLALSAAPGSGATGRLTSDQIYGLNLDANLVVLSACRSGGGVVTGDGIAGLARAFFYAGASSLIVSVWDVADESAHHLLPAFYRAWLRGATKASALRRAQLQMIHDLRAGTVTVDTPAGSLVLPEDPAFWAGFVLLGEPD